MLTTLRRRAGLFWAKQRPTLHELGFTSENLLVIGMLVCLFGVIDAMNRASEAEIERDRQQLRADLNRAAMVACLRGEVPELAIEHTNGTHQVIDCRTKASPPFTVATVRKTT